MEDIAKRLTSGPFANPSDYSKVVGEQLGKPVFWQGRQWAITPRGIECRNGKYFIPADRLWSDEGEFGWIEQMEEKDWVDLQDFSVALTLARIRFKEKFRRT